MSLSSCGPLVLQVHAIRAARHRTPAIVTRVARTAVVVDAPSILLSATRNLRLQRLNRIHAVHGTPAIEGNAWGPEQSTAIVGGVPAGAIGLLSEAF